MANVFWATGLVLKVLVWASVVLGLIFIIGYTIQTVIDFWKEIRDES